MKRITEYDNITNIAENDVLPIVDVSDTTQASSGSTKKGTIAKIADYLKSRVETLTNKTLSTDDNTFLGFLDWFYPIGTIYETTSIDLDTTTKMNAHFGGTWEEYGAGRVLVAKSADTEFDTIGKTGGEKAHTLTIAEIPSHTHNLYGALTTSDKNMSVSNQSNWWVPFVNYTDYNYPSLTNTGGGGAHNNLQPYIVVFRYRRVS